MKSLLLISALFCLSLPSVLFANNQATVVTLNGKYYVIDSGTKNEGGGDVPPVVVPPVDLSPQRFNGNPTGVLDSNTTVTALSLNTDVTAECRYQATWPGITFETMTPFAQTNATFHYQLVTVQQSTEDYRYSVRCKNNTTGSTNEDNYNIIFSVGVDGGDDPTTDVGPVRSNGQPTGTLVAGTTSTVLSVNTDVTAECRYKPTTSGLTFDTMTPMTTTNSVLHQQLITGLADGEHYEYSIRCKDNTTLVINQKNYNVPFDVGIAAKIGEL